MTLKDRERALLRRRELEVSFALPFSLGSTALQRPAVKAVPSRWPSKLKFPMSSKSLAKAVAAPASARSRHLVKQLSRAIFITTATRRGNLKVFPGDQPQ